MQTFATLYTSMGVVVALASTKTIGEDCKEEIAQFRSDSEASVQLSGNAQRVFKSV
jgi:hypothetical protein